MLNPPFMKRFSRESRSPAVTKSGTFYYPMWLAYATGVLERAGFETKLIDAPAKGLKIEDILTIVKSFKPKLVVINTSTPSINKDIECANKIKETFPEIFVTLVGRHVSALFQETIELSESIDAIAVGEYDYTIRDLAFELSNNSPNLYSVKGIVWRNNGKIIKNELREYIYDLDKIPFVSEIYMKHLDIYDYFYAHSRYPIVVIVSGRGCPYQCFYCCYPQTMFGHKLRLRSPENIAKEFEYIAKNLPFVKEIMIEDDTFTVNKKHVEELCDLLIKKGNKIPFSANSRADLTDYRILKKLKKAGCRLLCVGYESGNQQILDNIKKNLKLKQAIEFTKLCKKVGILIHGCFMVGNPGETKETLEETLEFAKRINPDTVQFYPLMVYPGTEAYRWTKNKGYLVTENYSYWLNEEGEHNTVVNNPQLNSEYLLRFCDRARREFYLRPKYIIGKIRQSLKDFSEGYRNLKSFRRFVKYLILRK